METDAGAGSVGVHAVKQIGKETRGQAQALKGKLLQISVGQIRAIAISSSLIKYESLILSL